MKSLRSFFWFCSGAVPALLKRCPSESEKYAGIGATVFFTAVFATFSAGYALYTVFDLPWMALGIGLVWGLMIFNLDRYIVSSMVKRGGSELKMMLPRLALAILLALVISKPLELKIFEKEIIRKLDIKKSEEVIKARESIRLGNPEFAEIDQQIAALRQEVAAKEAFRNQKQAEYDFERFGTKTPGTTGIPGIGTNARKKEQQLNEAQQDLERTELRVQEQIAELESRKQALRLREDSEFAAQKANIDRYDGLAARIDALHQLTVESDAMKYANWFIILLFIAIEIAPILVKFISSAGPYDELLDAHETEMRIYKNERVSKSKMKSETRLLLFTDKEKNQVEEAVNNDRFYREKVAKAEKQIVAAHIDDWLEEEKRTKLGW